jgi:hypothetical protein
LFVYYEQGGVMVSSTISGRSRTPNGLQSGRPSQVLQWPRKPDTAARRYLSKGLGAAGNKLPLFDADGQRIKADTVRKCVERGWAEPWFTEQVEPGWPVHRLTAEGLAVVTARGERN